MNAIDQIKAGIKSAERAGKQADVEILKAYLVKMEADHANKIAHERRFQQVIRPKLVAKWAKNMDFRPY
jgi:hypothetical protein